MTSHSKRLNTCPGRYEEAHEWSKLPILSKDVDESEIDIPDEKLMKKASANKWPSMNSSQVSKSLEPGFLLLREERQMPSLLDYIEKANKEAIA